MQLTNKKIPIKNIFEKNHMEKIYKIILKDC